MRFIVALVLALSCGQLAWACKCGGSTPLCESFPNLSDDQPVFLGRVTRSTPEPWSVFESRLQKAVTPLGITDIDEADSAPADVQAAFFAAYLRLQREYWRGVLSAGAQAALDAVEDREGWERWADSLEDGPDRTVEFEVLEVFNGEVGASFTLTSGLGARGDCSPRFAVGDEYLVFAHGEPGDWSTSVCAGTSDALGAKAKLEYLRSRSTAPETGRIYGRLQRHELDLSAGRFLTRPVAGSTVFIEYGEEEWKALTDADGNYSLDGLEPGSYVVSAALEGWSVELQRPTGWAPLPDGSIPVTVRSKGCANVDLVAREPQGTITGRLLDASGQPLAGVNVDLLSLEQSVLNKWQQTGGDGRFVFREVHSGQYLVGVNIDRPPTADARMGSRYASSYYPGVADVERASEIHVPPGEKIQLFDQTLPAELPLRTIRGRVVRTDGGSVVGASVTLELPGFLSNVGWQSVDEEDGEFALEGLDALAYKVSSYLWLDSGKEKWEAKTAVPPDPDEVLLILKLAPGRSGLAEPRQ